MIEFNVYNDGVIAVTLVAENADHADRNLMHLGIRWLSPQSYFGEDGAVVEVANIMGGETDRFLLPHTFGAAVGRKLVEQKAARLPGFNDEGFARLIAWLVGMGEISDAMCY